MGRMYILKVECCTSPKPCGKNFTDEARCNDFRICTSSEFQIRLGPIHGQNVGSMVASRSKTSKQNLTPVVATAVSEAVPSVSSVGPVYETATLRSEDIWPYNPDTKEKFATKNMKRKGYSEGIDQIENTPEIAPVEGELSDLDTTADMSLQSPLVISEPAPAPAPAKKPAKSTPAGKNTPASKAKETPKAAA